MCTVYMHFVHLSQLNDLLLQVLGRQSWSLWKVDDKSHLEGQQENLHMVENNNI